MSNCWAYYNENRTSIPMSSRLGPQFIGPLSSGSTSKNGSLSQGNPEDVIAFDLNFPAKVSLSGLVDPFSA